MSRFRARRRRGRRGSLPRRVVGVQRDHTCVGRGEGVRPVANVWASRCSWGSRVADGVMVRVGVAVAVGAVRRDDALRSEGLRCV
jgi:hypothetical protein